MDASSPVSADPFLPPVLTGLVVLVLLAIVAVSVWGLIGFAAGHLV
ncbi:hypothetical protein [Streptomyces sp. NPDC004435]